MHHLNVKVKRSWKARMQATLHDTSFIPGSFVLSRVFGILGGWRRKRALQGVARIKTIVVGSQTFGGAGKTPVTLHLAQYLDTDFKVGVLVRPTRRGGGFEGVVRSKKEAAAAGDEALMLWLRLPGTATLFVFKDLVQGQQLADGRVDCLVIDDGLRQSGLSSDLSIVVIDHGASKLVFPRGPCRENERIASYADVVWVNKIDEPCGGHQSHGDVTSRYRPIKLINIEGETLDLEALSDHPITIVSGIGRPASFYHSLLPYLGTVQRVFEYGDHEPFDFPTPICDSELIVTTEKDLARGGAGKNVWAVRVDLELESGGNALNQRLLQVMN
jgi:tetraacyldisaccharide 4'-kinase